MLRNYYAVESFYGHIFIGSTYGQPTLHVFESKQERDEYVRANDTKDGNINHRFWEISAKDAYKYYSHIVDGVREWSDNREEH